MRIAGLYICLWAALVIAAMARALGSESAAAATGITLFWAAVHGVGLAFAYGRQTDPSARLTERIALIGMVAFLFELLLGHLTQALMSLLLWLQAARNPALSTRRDVYFALAISLALV